MISGGGKEIFTKSRAELLILGHMTENVNPGLPPPQPCCSGG